MQPDSIIRIEINYSSPIPAWVYIGSKHMSDMFEEYCIEKIVKEAIENDIKLVGLSALMTTTIVSMEETILALKEAGFKGKIFVGGAVLTEDYSDKIGADFYAKDAKESVEIAKKVFNN